jgi:hypothetical protein
MPSFNLRRIRGSGKGKLTQVGPEKWENPYEKLPGHVQAALQRNAVMHAIDANNKEAIHAYNMSDLFPEQHDEIMDHLDRTMDNNNREAQTHVLVQQNPSVQAITAAYKAELAANPDLEGGYEISGDALARAKRLERPAKSTDVVEPNKGIIRTGTPEPKRPTKLKRFGKKKYVSAAIRARLNENK